MAINWGLLGNQQGQFQNALAMGAQFGAAAAERKNKKEFTNALMTVFQPGPTSQGGVTPPTMGGGQGIVATPEQRAESERLARQFGMEGVLADDRAQTGDSRQAAMAVIARQNPDLFIQLQQQAAQQAQAAERADLQRRAFTDPTALTELAGVDLDAARGLRTDQKQQVALTAKQRGQAALMAMEALRTGNSQRAREIVANYAQTTGDNEAAGILELDPQQFELQLGTAISQAEMVDDLFERLDPNYVAVPNDATLVNTRDPAAVSQFGQGAARQVVRTGKDAQGRSVVQYSDGTIEYAGGAAGNGSGGF